MTKRCRIPVVSVDRIEIWHDADGIIWGWMAQADGLVAYGSTRQEALLDLRRDINRWAFRERRDQAIQRKAEEDAKKEQAPRKGPMGAEVLAAVLAMATAEEQR